MRTELRLNGGNQDDILWGDGDNDGSEQHELGLSGDIENILSGTGADIITVNSNQNIVIAGDGADSITATSGGDDLIFGDGGNDTINSGSGNDSIFAPRMMPS
jgi:Ca2+-binding RTX toxin-like protein